MKTLHLIALASIIGFGSAASTDAGAVPAFPQLLATGAALAQGHYQLVQYGGGDDDDDDYTPPSRPQGGGYGGGGYRPQGGGHRGGNGGAVLQQLLITGGQLIQQSIKNKQRQQFIQEQANRNAASKKAQQQRQAKDNAAANRKKAQQQAREKELKAEKLQEAKDKALLQQKQNAQEQELKDLKEQVKQDALKKLQEEATKQEEAKYPSSDEPDQEEYTTKDKMQSGTNIVIRVTPRGNYSSIENIPNLVINNKLQVPGCGYVNLPADRQICTGTTASGGWIRVVNVPMTTGGTQPACVQFCRTQPKIPEKFVVVTPPKTNPTPIVVPTPPPPDISNKTITSATRTVYANKVIEPEKKIPPTPATRTVYANKVIEPEKKIPPTPATRTVYANKVIEPEKKIPPTPATRTVYANKVIEPEKKIPPTPATRTVYANKVVEPEKKIPPTPATKTVFASTVVETEKKIPPTPATKTVFASTVVESEKKTPATPAKKTVVANTVVETEKHSGNDPSLKPAAQSDDAELDEAKPAPSSDSKKPDPTPPGSAELDSARPPANSASEFEEFLNTRTRRHRAELQRSRKAYLRQKRLDEQAAEQLKQQQQRQKEAEAKQKEAEARKYALEHPGPLDGKGCTVAGAKPVAKLVTDFPYRELVTGGLSAIPKVGGMLSGITKLLWKDKGPNQLFDQMKKYVDDLVPDLINQYDKKQLDGALEGLKSDLADYSGFNNTETRKGFLISVLSDLNKMQPHFLNPELPEGTLAEFIAFGTLKLAALRETYDNFDRYFPVDPSKPESVKQQADDHARIARQISETVKEYTAATQRIRAKIIENRLAKVRVKEDTVPVAIGATEMGNIIYDEIKLATVQDDFCDWHGPGHQDDDRPAAQGDLQRRKDAVKSAYNDILDVLMLPVASWPSTTVAAAPVVVAQKQ